MYPKLISYTFWGAVTFVLDLHFDQTCQSGVMGKTLAPVYSKHGTGTVHVSHIMYQIFTTSNQRMNGESH